MYKVKHLTMKKSLNIQTLARDEVKLNFRNSSLGKMATDMAIEGRKGHLIWSLDTFKNICTCVLIKAFSREFTGTQFSLFFLKNKNLLS